MLGLKSLGLRRRDYIAIFKGTLAYSLAFILIFLAPFNNLNKYPIVLSSIVLITLAGGPGKSIGACWDGAFFGALGVGTGGLGFFVLAKLSKSQVAQGFVFFIIVYFYSIAKALSMRYFGFSLLGIIMSFSGIYTSILLGEFSSDYLIAYLEAYAWGFALVLSINLFVFPTTAERELRTTLASSLDHISTFSHLIAKTYILEITEEEKLLRDSLNQSIRADFAFLSQRLSETSIEINWTKWSIKDYSKSIGSIRNMQQGLITTYSSLISMELDNPKALDIIKESLASDSQAFRAFSKLRSGVALSIDEIVEEFGVGELHNYSQTQGGYSWDDFRDFDDESLDLEKSAEGRARAVSISVDNQARLALVSSRLRKEVSEQNNTTPMGSRRNSFSDESEKKKGSVPASITAKGGSNFKSFNHATFLLDCWQHFEKEQNRSITDLLSNSTDEEEDELYLHQPGPSLHQLYSQTDLTQAYTSATRPTLTQLSKRSAESGGSSLHPTTSDESDTAQFEKDTNEDSGSVCSTAVMRVYSFLFGMGEVVKTLADLHEFVVTPQRTKSLHFHLFESIPKVSTSITSMSLPEALAALQGRVWVKPKKSIWTLLQTGRSILFSEVSFFAFKVACAVSVYAVFILAPSLQAFFVEYGLTGGVITIVVAISPTLGQSLIVFILQIMGTGFGALYGLIILLIFKGVGEGYYWNPYGLVVLLTLYAIPGSYIIYVKPQFFAGALLALNGTGILVVTEWTYREVATFIRPTFDSAALRAAKALVAMSLALVVAAVFMIFIFRTPSKKTLRLKLAELTFALGSYNILFSAVGEAIVPLAREKDQPPPPPEAVARVKAELNRREGQMQGQLLALMPLLKFSSVEPSFGVPFQGKTIARVIRHHQLILDRLRESRVAVGEGLSEEIQINFTRKLSPYRRQTKRFSRALFYLVASSLSTKTPLPHELPSLRTTAKAIQHDAILLSRRLAKQPNGREIIQSNSFLRYFFYLVSYSSVSFQLEQMETDLRILFGEVEDHIAR